MISHHKYCPEGRPLFVSKHRLHQAFDEDEYIWNTNRNSQHHDDQVPFIFRLEKAK